QFEIAHPAPDHHRIRIEDVDDRGDRLAKLGPEPAQGRRGRPLAPGGPRGDLGQAQAPARAPPGEPPQPRPATPGGPPRPRPPTPPPPPHPVPRISPTTTPRPRPAPSLASASAKQLASFASRASTPSAAARSSRRRRPFRHVVFEVLSTPVGVSMAPGVPIPMQAGLLTPDSLSSKPTSFTTCDTTWSSPRAPPAGT